MSGTDDDHRGVLGQFDQGRHRRSDHQLTADVERAYLSCAVLDGFERVVEDLAPLVMLPLRVLGWHRHREPADCRRHRQVQHVDQGEGDLAHGRIACRPVNGNRRGRRAVDTDEDSTMRCRGGHISRRRMGIDGAAISLQ